MLNIIFYQKKLFITITFINYINNKQNYKLKNNQ